MDMWDLRKRIVGLAFLAFVVMPLSSCQILSESLGKAVTEEKPVLTKELFAKGQALYQKQCSVCHGAFGAADGKAAYLLYPKPRNFVSDKFRLVSTTNMEATDEDLFTTVTRGMSGSAMPPWNSLSAHDRWALVYYIRYLSEIEKYKKSGEITDEIIKNGIPWELTEKIINKKIDPATLIEIPTEPSATEDSLAKGRDVFLASCAGCHGKEGKGDGQQAMKDNLGYPLKPRDLTAGIFKGESTSKALYCRMVGGIPGSPMPSYTGALTQEQIWDLIHYVQTLPKPGAEERTRLSQNELRPKKIDGEIPLDPSSAEWEKVKPVFISLTPLWWRNERVEGVEVRILQNKKDIAFHLTWVSASSNSDAIAIQSFPDAAAIQFSSNSQPPFFGMGEKENPVTIWHWKASWQSDTQERQDVETKYQNMAVDWYRADKNYQPGCPFDVKKSKTQFHDSEFITGWGAGNPLSDPGKKTASEIASAAGLGSYTTQKSSTTDVSSQGVWKDGRWRVVFVRSLAAVDQEDLQFKPGKKISVAFAIWDGSHADRNGQKMVSIWNTLILAK